MVTNGKKLLSTKIKNELDCLNGIKVISMIWIILCHRFQYFLLSPTVNPVKILQVIFKKIIISKLTKHLFQESKELKNSYLLAVSMPNDTFFTISGILVTYTFMKSQQKNIKFSIPRFYIHRILRYWF